MKNNNPEPINNVSLPQKEASSKTRRFTKKKSKPSKQNQQKEVVLSVQSTNVAKQGQLQKKKRTPAPKTTKGKGKKAAK